MAKAYSMDLREQVVGGEWSGTALAGAARRPGSKWRSAQRSTGSTGIVRRAAWRPGRSAGIGPRSLLVSIGSGCCGDARERAFTLRGLVRELVERGLSVDYRVVWAFVPREKLSYKKDADCQRARSSRRGAATSAMDGLSGSHRSGPSGLHRRDLDQDQHGAIARLEPPSRTPTGKAPARAGGRP